MYVLDLLKSLLKITSVLFLPHFSATITAYYFSVESILTLARRNYFDINDIAYYTTLMVPLEAGISLLKGCNGADPLGRLSGLPTSSGFFPSASSGLPVSTAAP